MPRADYEDRQERRRERLEDRAEKKHAEATARWAASDRLSRAMDGQPVLVGHHSEKRHRRDIDHMWSNPRKGCEAHRDAEDLEHRATSVGTAGVSSDDPEAVTKLQDKLASLKAGQERMKVINAAWRKAGKPKASSREIDGEAWKAAIEKHPGLEPLLREALQAKRTDFMERPPYSYSLSNQSAEIRRLEQRIKGLEEAEAAPDHEPTEGDGWRIWEDKDENRLFIAHDSKPSTDVRAALKRHGFRWNRYATAWSRMLNNSAWANAEYLAQNGHLD